MANKFSSMPSVLHLLLLVANLLMLLAPPVKANCASGDCNPYSPAASGTAGSRAKRLAGGSDGDIGQMPFMVSITYNYNFTSIDGHRTFDGDCTGTLVSRRHVLTTGHCAPLARMPNSSYLITVQYGSADKSAGSSITVPTSSYHRNPQASSYQVDNSAFSSGKMTINLHDTALIDLGQDLELSETVQPICVACLDNQTFPEGPAYIAGWGNIKPVCSGEAEWQDVFKFESVDVHQCLTSDFLTTDKVCTQADSSHGIGGGDGGGPVLASADGQTYLQVAVLGNTNCLSTAREDGSIKIDQQWFEQITGVTCKKLSVTNTDGCEEDPTGKE